MHCGIKTSRLASVVAISLLVVSTAARPAFAQDATRCGPRQITSSDLLSLDLESLLNIKVVTASKFSESQSDAPGVISVVSQDELRRFGGATLREVLERVPGLASSTAYFTDRSIVAARGDQTKINGGHVLFLVNGRPTREVLEGGLASDLLEAFPVNVLERIEVIKGPGSVLYGSNAFSAVVNLITVPGEANGFSFSGAPGTGGARQVSGEGTYTCGDLHIVGGAQIHQRPDWNTTYWFNNPIPDDPFAAGVPVVQDATIRDRSRGGFGGITYKSLSVMSSFTEWRTAAFVRGTVGENRWRRGFADVGYAIAPSRLWKMNLNATYTRNLFNIDEFPFIARDSNELLFEWTNFVNPTSRDQVTFGVLHNQIHGHETFFGLGFPINISDSNRGGSAGYAQIDHRLASHVKVIGGFQANKIGSLSLDVVPRAGMIWSPADRWNVKALYGQAFRAPSINETTLMHPGLRGSADLRPENVATFDLELSYHGDRVQGSANYFRSRHTDSITIDTSEQVWRYVNRGEATFQGVEVDGKYYVNRNVYVLGSLLHQVNEDSDGMKNVTPVPNTSAKGGISFQNERGITASIFENYQGSINGFSSILNPPPTSRHLLSAHARLELGALLKAPPATGLAVVVNGDNLTDGQVWLPDWGGNTGDTIPARRGRTVYVGVEVAVGHRPGTRVNESN
jgi:outer membrane receptor protein involved in Fe transport